MHVSIGGAEPQKSSTHTDGWDLLTTYALTKKLTNTYEQLLSE